MAGSDADEIEIQARRLLAERGRPRRRAQPRMARALIEAEEVRLPLASGEVAAWRVGEGPAVLFVHGWEDDNALWGPALDLFRQWGRAVVAIDLPGHGHSSANDATVREASAAVRAAAQTLGPVFAVVGHSYGCAAIIHALGHGLEVEKAVLIATPTPRSRARRPLEFEGVDPPVLARAEAIRRAHGEAQDARIEALIRALSTPALAVHSIDDDRTPLSNAQKLTELWPGARLLLADGLGHRLVAQDDDILQQVVAFVEG